MYYHKHCDGYIFASQRIEMYSGLTVTAKGIVIAGIGRVQITASNAKESILICSTCDKVTPPEEIYSRCMQCGHEFSIDELYIPSTSGGHYCKNCSGTYYPDEKLTKVSTAIRKIAEQ